MPENPTPKDHIVCPPNYETLKFSGRAQGKFVVFPRDRHEHAEFLKRKLSDVEAAFEAEKQNRAETGQPFGLILEVTSEPGHNLQFVSLEATPTKRLQGIELLNLRIVKTKNGNVQKASIFVPFGRLKVLQKKVENYAVKDGKPRKDGTSSPSNEKLLANISDIAVAALEALWTDAEILPAEDGAHWWEFWVRRCDGDWESQFIAECKNLGIEVLDQRLEMPDQIIYVGKSGRSTIESSLDLLNTLSEVRKARPCSIGLTDLSTSEQFEWIEEALERIYWPVDVNCPAVCLIDTGVNRAHPLLEPILREEDLHSIIPHLGEADHPLSSTAHGTSMAGIAAFDDLRKLMLNGEEWTQGHRIESVKLIHEGNEHEPENFGALTQQAIYLPEIEAPDRSRVYCLAITSGSANDKGHPTAWSSAIDSVIAGANEEDAPKRIVIVSAGNVRSDFSNYPESCYQSKVEDPAQSWNAVCVGASTMRSAIEEDDPDSSLCEPLALPGGLSPFSRTTLEWEPRWPTKPDIVMEGGNLGKSPDGDVLTCDSLSVLTTAPNFLQKPITTFTATSAAAASASRLCARMIERYPDRWPETIRGMLVHSARWSDEMLDNGQIDPYSAGASSEVQRLLRIYGFGIPNETRALHSFENSATLINEADLQPYAEPAGDAKLNQCNLHQLQWPTEELNKSPDAPVTMRVTLSYYIEPNPGTRMWEKNKKYQYASCLLRFRPKHKDQSIDEFRDFLIQYTSDYEKPEDGTKPKSMNDPGWAVGSQLRGKGGSIVQDIWQGSAAQLAEMGHIAVFPVKGWWATRKYKEDHEWHQCHLRKQRYSLIISLEADADIPIHSTVTTIIELDQEIDL